MKIKRITYKDQVIEFIYKEILKGNIKANEQIKESHLSNKLNISRAPIREALKELVSMGLLEYKPRIGTFVVDMSPDDIYDSYCARGILEGYAASHSFDTPSKQYIENLRNMCEEMELLAEKNDNIKLIELGDRFHKKLYHGCKNRQIVHFTEMLSLKSHLLFSKYWPELYSAKEIKKRHMKIVDAMQSKNQQEIEITVRNHYEETGRKIADLKEKEIKK